MPSDKVRLGIIGVGWWAVGVHWNFLKKNDGVEVAAISRRNKDLLALASEIMGVSQTYTRWEEMLEKADLDAVLIATPTKYHAEHTIAALEKGLHVLLEKPMAMTMAEAQAMIAAEESSKGNLMIGLNSRCEPAARKVHNLIQNGAIGTMRQISIVSHGNHLGIYDEAKLNSGIEAMLEKSGPIRPFFEEVVYKGNWRADPEISGGGMFVDIKTHVIDRCLWHARSGPREVSCLLTKTDLPVERAITTQAVLDNGVLFSLSFTDGVDTGPDNVSGGTTVTIAGDEGVMEWGKGPSGSATLITNGEETEITTEEASIGTSGEFIKYISEGGENPAPASECAWTVALIEASYTSAREKKIIHVG